MGIITRSEGIMNQDLKNKLIGILPFNKNSVHKFIPKFLIDLELGEEFTPVFDLKPLTIEDRYKLISLIKTDETPEQQIKNEVKRFDIIRKYIDDWNNLYDIGTDDYIDFAEDDGGCKMELLKSLPNEIITEIAKKLLELSGLNFEVKKK
jgi:hypothetical protein